MVGLKTKYPQVKIVGVGAGTKIRGKAPDINLEIPASEIRPGDVLMLGAELNLKETAPSIMAALEASFGKKWLSSFRILRNKATMPDPKHPKRTIPAPDSVSAWAYSAGVNSLAAEGLHGKLNRLFNRRYIVNKPAVNGVKEIAQMLESGQHVILSFGNFESDLDYMLISNVLTRKIREHWEKRTNAFRNQGGRNATPPRPLTIVVEEAHKLLSQKLAKQTSFGQIAREMRKYYVTLLVIDQRPCEISPEVMSQLGTRISGSLANTDDITSVLAGLSHREAMQGMLARLQPKQEALLMGWGTPMPIPIKTRRYDDKFWKDLLGKVGVNNTTQPDIDNANDILSNFGY